MKPSSHITVQLDKIVGGGQALGTLEDGRKVFVWGGLPGETVTARITKKKASYIEAVVESVEIPSKERIAPRDPDSYLSTSPWQIMSPEVEQHYKAALIEEAFELHGVTLPHAITVRTDGNIYGYRNKIEFSWYGSVGEEGVEKLDLAFFRRGSKGKIPVRGTSLAHENINTLARSVRDLLQHKGVSARELKTLLIRSDSNGACVWQLYVKDNSFTYINATDAAALPAIGGEVIYSDPKSPASRITKRLALFGNAILSDKVLGIDFSYATEGFFQINLPVYEQSLLDMKSFMPDDAAVLDLYSGVGTIGLTIGGDAPELIEINEDAVREMNRNIERLDSNAHAILASSESAVDYITAEKTIIVDPPRAGLHDAVIERLLQVAPHRIIYLSCNPVTQARDVSNLAASYRVIHHEGYNFFPRTPHIEHLVILERK